VLIALYALRDFGAVSVMRVDTFTRVIYLQYRTLFDRASAAALALVLLAVAAVLVYLEMRARGRRPAHRSGPGAARHQSPVPLGRWRPAALALAAGVPIISLVAPALVLAYWLTRGLGAGLEVPPRLLEATAASLAASSVGAAATLGFALPIALLATRRRSAPSALADRVAHLGYAMPGIVVALAYVFAESRFPIRLQPLVWLGAAYVVLFLPQATGAVRSALAQVPPSVEEAAHALGRDRASVFRTITLPLVSPGVAAALALVFLTAMKELPATLVLSPLGFQTLPMQVWSSVTEAFFARAAAPALALILFSSAPLAILLRRLPGDSL
jgi:iron(III) transport system permease protein